MNATARLGDKGMGERSLSTLQLTNTGGGGMFHHNEINGHGGIGGVDPRDRAPQPPQQQRPVNPMLTAAKAGDPPSLHPHILTLSYTPSPLCNPHCCQCRHQQRLRWFAQ